MTTITQPSKPEFTRQELLELSAQAIGLVGAWDEESDCFVPESGPLQWDPLTDSRETEYLFTKLKMTMEDSTSEVIKVTSRVTGHFVQYPGFYTDANPLEAMRQIIVTVAARGFTGSSL